jgi:hypothetical protein
MRSAIKALPTSPRTSTRATALPLPPPCRTPPFACFLSQWTLLAPALGHSEAHTAAHCPTPPLSSPEFWYPWLRRHCAAAARRQRLWSHQAHQSTLGKLNCTDMPFVCLPRSHITGGELASAAGDRLVRDCGPDTTRNYLICDVFSSTF